MFRILFRLYLVTIVSYSAAIYLVPDLVIMVFRERFITYNLDYSRGLQSLITAVSRGATRSVASPGGVDGQGLPAAAHRTGAIDDAGFPPRAATFARGENVVRIGDWGWRTWRWRR
jgi:two-component system OmpR family sensor kinase